MDGVSRYVMFEVNRIRGSSFVTEREAFTPMDKYTVGAQITRLRKAAGLTQEKLAARLGFQGTSRLGNYEAGVNLVPTPVLPDLASALGVSIEAILTGDENVVPHPGAISVNGAAGHVILSKLPGFASQSGLHEIQLPEFLVRRSLPAELEIKAVKWLLNPSESMAPRILPGALVLVDSTQNDLSHVQDGEIYVVRAWGGRPDIRRIFISGNNEYRLTGDRESERRLDLTGEDYKSLEIGGRVIDAL